MTLAPLRHGDQPQPQPPECDTSGLCPNFSGDQPAPGSPSPGLSDLPHSANVWGNIEHTNLCPTPDNLQIKFQFARHCVRWPGCRVSPLILLQNTMQIGSPGSRLQTSICKVASLDHNSAAAGLGWAGLDQGQFNHCVVCLLCEARRDRRVIKC